MGCNSFQSTARIMGCVEYSQFEGDHEIMIAFNFEILVDPPHTTLDHLSALHSKLVSD